MKKAFKITGISVLALLALMIVLPFLFKGKITEQVKKEINKNLNAKVAFGRVGLNLFSHFPDMTLSVKDLTVVGIDEFNQDTLADMPSVSVTLNLMSVFKGSDYEMKQIEMDKPKILLKVLKNGKANWDIVKPSAAADTTAKPSEFKVLLKKIRIEGADFVYDDAETPMYFAMADLSGSLSGDLSADKTTLDLDLNTAAVTADYDNVRYISNIGAALITKLDADLNKWIFGFKNAALELNAFRVNADGFFAMPDDGYDMDIRFIAKDNDFKAFLSLIPAIYAKDFEQVKTSGKLSFDGYVKGKYTDLLIPAFGLNLVISDGMFSYPSLPGKVSEINVEASVSNPDGNTDHTVIDMKKLHVKMLDNPIDGAFTLKTPVSDPEIDGYLKGVLNLSDLTKIYPLGEQTSLKGILTADVAFKGRMSSIENGNYDQFKAAGQAAISGLSYAGPDVPKNVSISKAHIAFSPAFITLDDFSLAIGNNDLAASGKIENYLPYFFRDNAELHGYLKTSSKMMDLNTLIPASSAQTSPDSSSLTVVDIPGNIDFTLSSSFDRLIYDTYDMSNANGTVKIRNKTLYLEGLKVHMLDGNVAVNGTYSTIDPSRPMVDMDLKIEDVNVKKAFTAFNTVKLFAPICEKLNGNFTTNLKFSGALKKDMMPEMASVTGAGLVLSNMLSVDNVNTFNVIADVLKIEKLRRPALEKVNLSFDLVDGKATVKPMDFKLGSYKSNFSGTIGLDKALNFILTLEIPRSDFGGSANGVLNGLVSDASRKGLNVKLGDIVPVTLLIGGTVTDPKVTAGIKQALSGVVDDLKQQAIAQVQQKKEEVIAKAKQEANKWIDQADAEAARIVALAQQQSDAVMKTARLSADKLKAQADSASGKVMAEGKKNGMIAEIAAKKTAEKIKKEADAKSNKILDEAKAKSDAILNKAKAEAEQIKQQARSRVK